MITTFYSYKGGVGRSFVALETAARLAASGARVVVWDLDLEAPGLQRSPALAAVDEASRGGGFTGTLDLIQREVEGTSLDADAVRAALVPFEHPRVHGELSFLLPATLDDHYAERFARVPWAALFGPGDKPGVALLHRIGRLLREELEYDHVLVDARTGFTDLAAASTLLLPDCVVVVYTLAMQGLGPVSTATKRLTDQGIRYRRVLNLVPDKAQLDEGGTAALEERLRHLAEIRLAPHVRITYRPERVLREGLPTLDGSDADTEAFTALSSWLAEQAQERRRDDEVELVERRRRHLDARDRRGLHERAKRFEEEIAELFRLAGYEAVVDYELSCGQFDLRLTRPGDLMGEQILVECKDTRGRVGYEDILKLSSKVDAAQRDEAVAYRALLVSRSGFTAQAHDVARKNLVELRTVDDVLRSLVDVAPMVHEMVRTYEGSPLERLWVEPDLVLEGKERRPATEQLDAWLREPGSPVLALLGDFGTGKTSLARHWAHQLGRRHLDDRTASRAPYFVDLRDAGSRDLKLEGVLESAYRKVTGRGLATEGLLRRNREGHLILVLDGFDEMLAYIDPTLTREVLRQLLRAAERGAKVLLTCRTHFFRDQPDEQSSLAGEAKLASAAATGLYEELKEVPGAKVAYLQPFTPAQIDRYLQLAAPPPQDWHEVRTWLRESYELERLATQPFLLDLMVRSLRQLAGRTDVTVTDLYEVYAQGWLDRNSPRFQILREPAERWQVVELLARTLWAEPGAEVHYERIADFVAEAIERDQPLGPAERLQLDAEIRTATFLNRDPDGMYRFMHRSFLEFFVARGMRRGLREGDASCLDLPRLTRPIARFLDGFEESDRLENLLREVLHHPYRRQVSENALLLAHWRGLTEATTGAQLAGARLSELGLQGVVLPGADLPGADLRGATLGDARLERADLTAADLSEAELRGADLREAVLDGANLSHADLGHGRLDGADLSGADLTRTNLAHASVTLARWEGARFWGTGLLGTGFAPTDARPAATGRAIPGHLQVSAAVGHHGPVYAVAAIEVGGRPLLATGAADGTVRLWDPASGDALTSVTGHSGAVNAVAALDINGRALLATGSADGTAHVWDPTTSQLITTLTGHTAPVASLTTIDVAGRTLVATGAADGTGRLWDPTTGETLTTLTGHTGPVTAVATIDLDGRTVLTTGSADGTARLWDPTTGEALTSITTHTGPVHAVAAVNLDGRTLLATGCDDGTVRLWDPNTSQVITTLTARGGPVHALAVFDLDGRTLLATGSHDGTARLWDPTTGETLTSLVVHADWPLSLTPIDLGGRTILATGTGVIVLLWDPTTAKTLVVTGHTAPVTSVATIDVAGRTLVATGAADGTGRLWDPTTGETLTTLTGHTGPVTAVATIDLDGHTLLTTGSFDGTARLWEPNTGRMLTTLTGHTEPVTAVATIDLDGHTMLATGSFDGTARLWEPNTGRMLRTLTGHTEPVTSVAAIDLDGHTLLTTGSRDGTARLWDPNSGETLPTLVGHQEAVNTVVAIRVSGLTLLATGSHDGTARLWEPTTGRMLTTLTGHTEPVTSVAAVDLDGRTLLATGSRDGTARLWDPTTGDTLTTITGHTDWVLAVAPVDLDGRTLLVTSGDDGTARLWEPSTGALLLTVHHFPEGLVAVSDTLRVTGDQAAFDRIRIADGFALYQVRDVPGALDEGALVWLERQRAAIERR